MAMYNGRRVLQVVRTVGGGTTVYVNGQPVATFDADTKLDKQKGVTTYQQFYAKKADGSQDMFNFGIQRFGSMIPQRDTNGDIYVPDTPALDICATSKKYVDNHFSGVYKHDVTILLEMAGTGNEFYKIRGHVFNNSSTALTSLSGFFADLICEYGGDRDGNGYAVQKIPRGFAYNEFTNPRSAFIFTSSAGVVTYIDPSDTSVISDVSVSDVVAKL